MAPVSVPTPPVSDPAVSAMVPTTEETAMFAAAALTAACARFSCTDIGNGKRFSLRHSDKARFCATRKLWYLWDGRRWRADTGRYVRELAKQTAIAINSEVELFYSQGDRAERQRWARESESANKINAMLSMAESDVAIRIEPAEFDADGNLLCVRNGVIELDTGRFREGHRPEDLLTKVAGVAYVPGALCPAWEAHLNLIFAGNELYIRAIQELLGYSLVVGNPLQYFPIWHGGGSNGKSVTVTVVRTILGDYATTAAASVFMVKRTETAVAPEILALRGARLVVAIETERGHKLNEALVKSMTGGDELVGRALFSNEIERFPPTHLTILVTNPLPAVTGMEFAIWRRLLFWPFTVEIPMEQRIPDYEKVLLEEREGIFVWMLEGLRRYYAYGRTITIPEAVIESTKKHKAAMDVIGPFLAEECVREPDALADRIDLYERYEAWCRDSSEEALSRKGFANALREHGIEPHPFKVVGRRMWHSVRVKTAAELEAEEISGDRQERL